MDHIKVNPVQIQRFLEGLDYPATKDEIIEHARAEESDAAGLARLAPPAWTFLTLPLSPQSSTAIRRKKRPGGGRAMGAPRPKGQ